MGFRQTNYAVLKINKISGEVLFLMNNAMGTKTFRSGFAGAWTHKDHRASSNMLDICVAKYNDTDKFDYIIDDLNESGDW